ncbi:MAG TPA: hypothetical protein VFG87_12360 [Amycolatopsis sp.]|nr:hypothetical protein [Amycolatopsis sp.]
MRVITAPHVAVKITGDGRLELASAETGERYRFGPAETAMWIALWQHDGELEAAAAELANHWDADSERLRGAFDTWVRELHDVGLVRYRR